MEILELELRTYKFNSSLNQKKRGLGNIQYGVWRAKMMENIKKKPIGNILELITKFNTGVTGVPEGERKQE